MIVKLFTSDGVKVIRDAEMLLVCDDNDNPVSIACRINDQSFLVECINEPEKFNSVLRQLGVSKMIVPVDLQSSLLPRQKLVPI